LSKYYYFYLKIDYILNIIRTIFKHNSCESSDGRSKHMIYTTGNEVYGRI